MDWKISLETLKNSQNVISLSIYHPIRVASFTCPFTGNVCCTLTDTVNDLRCLQVLWQLCVSPSPLFNNHSRTCYIPFLKLSSLCHASFISRCSASLSCKRLCAVVNNQGFTHFVTIPTCHRVSSMPLWKSGTDYRTLDI
jgi:hypothetical protein